MSLLTTGRLNYVMLRRHNVSATSYPPGQPLEGATQHQWDPLIPQGAHTSDGVKPYRGRLSDPESPPMDPQDGIKAPSGFGVPPPETLNVAGNPYRGRLSDPETPPSGHPDADVFQAYEEGNERLHKLKFAVGSFLFVFVVLFLVWFMVGSKQTPEPLPKSVLRGKRIGGQDHFVDVNICTETEWARNKDCRADCHRMDSSRQSIVTGPQAMHELLNDAMHIKCDGEFYIALSVCNNPGEFVDQLPNPYYFVSTHRPAKEEFCKRRYSGSPIRVNFTLPLNTTVYLTVCVDGFNQPVQHEARCV